MMNLEKHLRKTIIPFWKNLIDLENGGFYGFVDNDLNVNKKAIKSIIAHTRLLYSFSLYYTYFKDDKYLSYMNHSYSFLQNHFKDKINNGYYWMLNYKGEVVSNIKHVYAQSFAIYALSEYALAINDLSVAKEAYLLYEVIEKKAKVKKGIYKEQFSYDWEALNENLLSNDDDYYPYTTNTLLHLLESYTNLYKICKTNELKSSILDIIDCFTDLLYNEKEKSFHMYLNKDLKLDFDGKSYGHDIETCWLLDKALEVIGVTNTKVDEITKEVVKTIYNEALTNKGLILEKIGPKFNKERIWWVQAEAMVGFLNEYQKCGNINYLEAVKEIFQFSKDYLIDKRPNSEWFWGVDENLKILDRPIAEGWKEPYHTSRAIIELLKRGIK